MKPGSTIVATAFALSLTGCSVEIDATDAVARVASLAEIRGDAEASADRPDGPGVWVSITALVKKEAVERVARWQVYPHVSMVECSSGKETNVGTEPRLGPIDFANAGAVKRLLKAHPADRAYRMQSLIFARKGDFQSPQCLRFEGGSYLGQKIIEQRIPIRTVGELP